MIAAAGEVKQQVNSTAQIIATNKLDNMITFLVNKSLVDVGVSVIREGAVNLVSAVFNILMSASYNADFRRNHLTQDDDRNKSRDIANRNMEAFDRVAEAVCNKQLSGQEDVEIQTKSAILSCRRASGHRAYVNPVVAGAASVQFPGVEAFFGGEAVDIQLLYIPTNPFTWDESSDVVTTSILDVKVKHARGVRQLINITDLSEEIDIQIPFATLPSAPTLDVFFKQTDNSSIQYHTFEVEETGRAIEFYVKPLEKQEEMTILVQFGKKPTILEHDMQIKLPDYSSCLVSIESSFKKSNCTEDPFSIFLPSTYLTQVGTYYIGVKYDVSSGNASDALQSRQKRDCGGGGRSKRSCIQYKDPPPTEPSNGKFVQNKQGYDQSTHSNYTMEQLGIGCSYWNPASNQFSSGGCRTGRRRTVSRTMSCRCKHLTSFGGGLLVKPNPIDFDTVWVAFADIHNNMAVLATIIAVFLFYLVVVVWARRADIRDHDSQEGIIVVGKSWNPYSYEITISTGKAKNSGTTANVTLIIVGEDGSSGVLPLSKLTKVKFNRGSVVNCTLYLPSWLGQLLYLHIWHDNSGDSPSWNLDHVVIRDTGNDEKWSFICGEWLAVESEEGKTDKVIYVAGIDEITNYKHLFLSNSADGLYDEHLWISVAAKPPQSTFSRVQRASCCLSLLFCTMITNAMFYDDGRIDTSPVFYLGPLKISLRQLVIGIQSSLIIFPINLAMTQLFRKTSSTVTVTTTAHTPETAMEEERKKSSLDKAKPIAFTRRFRRRKSSLKYLSVEHTISTTSLSTFLSPEDSHDYSSKEGLATTKSTLDLKKMEPTNPSSNWRNRFYRFLYYVAWVLCFVSVLVSAFFTLLYSMQWGKEKSQQWLLSFFVSFFQDVAISQPVKVAMFSAMLAFFVKFHMEHKRKRFYKNITKNDFEKEASYSTEMFDDNDACGGECQPLQTKDLKKAKLKRMKEMKSSQIMTDVLLYFMFLLLLLVVAYGHRDPIAYEMTNHLENQLSLSAQTYSDVWCWAMNSFIPTIFVGPWYNGKAPSASEDGLMIDRCSALVGMARIRQLRIKSDSCSYDIPLIKYLVNDCYGLYTTDDEDTNIYQPEWIPVSPDIPAENISHELCPRPWRYYTATDLKGVPMWGTTTWYSGGGYVAELGYYIAKAQEVISELALHKWLDRRSRGIFVELAVYNAQVNLFSVITLLAEAVPTGGVVTFRRIDTIRVYRYLGELGNVALAAELIICLVILFFLYKVIKRLYHQRLAFFSKFWNLVDLFQVLFALVSIALYFVKMASINKTMKDLSENPLVFVSFSMLLTWNEIDTYMIAFVVFLTTIKFLYLLRYNNHIKLLNQTFSNMREEILLFMVQFLFWFLPFVLMSHISFGTHLEDFISLPSAFQAMLNALLGASYFHDLQEVDRIIGPALFLTYSVLMELILLNMFVSIINAAFGNRETVKDSETDPELVEFLMKRFKEIFGFNMLFNSISPQKEEKWYVDDSSDEDNDYRRVYGKSKSRGTFIELDEKLSSLRDRCRTLSVVEEDEEMLLEMIFMSERHNLMSPRSEDSRTTESSV